MTTQLTNQLSLDSYGGVVTVTMPVASQPDKLDTLLPHWGDLQTQRVVAEVAELKAAEGDTHLIVTITSLHDSDQEPWGEIVRWIIQHVWEKLVALKIVTGPMPSIIRANQLNALPI